MELPINRPSQMSYTDELDFNKLLGKLKSERFNGFIRVTSGSGEGYILFNEGKQRASSFEDYSKIEALDEIKSIVKNNKALIEVFDIKKSQMDYIMELNKFFIIDSDLDSDLSVDDIIDELKKTEKIPAPVEEVKENPGAISSSVTETHKSIKDSLGQVYKQENEFIESGAEGENVDREDLMKKYGLKDVSEEEACNILETYKGGSLSDDDVEKIELMLMNKIKKLIFGIPKIRGSEVMVSLDNTSKVSGTVNIALEYKSKGLLSRIMGESRDLENLRREIINITQMEVKKSFKKYPEIVDDFVVIVWCKSF
jgi:hypothetical protein